MQNILPYKTIFPKIDESVFIAPSAWVIGDVEIGSGSGIWFNTVVRGDEHYIRIGSETNIQDNSTLHGTGGKFPVIVGSRVTVGHRAIIHGCVIEDECLIGMGAVLMDGVKIGGGSLVAGGAVLLPGTIVPPNSLVAGMPGVVKGPVTDKQRKLILHAYSHYVETAADYMQASSFETAALQIKGFLP
jgi:carbonic anhydrase/acetyltransferase-like protein (isoleucine patch superfamily)